MIGETDGCALWRNLTPITALQQQEVPGVEWCLRDDRSLGMVAGIVHQYDAVVLARLHWPPNEQQAADAWFSAIRRAGLAVIYELDDDLFTDDFVRRLVNLHGYSREDAEVRRAAILRVIHAADGMTVSTQRLATMLRQITDKPVEVVGNYIDLDWFRSITRSAERKVQGLTIGWAGGNRPDSDVAMMAEAWARIAAKYPHVRFIVQGHHARAIYDAVPNERIAMIDWLPIDQYPAGLVNIDIGCCPLSNTPFNRAKTYIKAMEYAAAGAAVVASPTVYGQLIRSGEDGYIASSVDEWEEALSRLVESYDERRMLQRALLSKVRKYHAIENNAWRWLVAWERIIEDFRRRQLNRITLPHEVAYAL